MMPMLKEKSFLRNLSIILEARESVISIKNEDSALRKESKLELTGANYDDVHKESPSQPIQYTNCFVATEEDY